jgi:hypothetical protein
MSEDNAGDRIRRAVEDSARDDDDVRGHQRNAAVAVLVLAVLVVGLLAAIVMGGFPGR